MAKTKDAPFSPAVQQEHARAQGNLSHGAIVVADSVKHQAGKVGQKLFDAYYAKGGLADMEKKVSERRAALASGVYEMAQTAYRLAHGATLFATYFAIICKPIETAIKHRAEKAGHPDFDNVGKVIPAYPVYKSEIGRAVKAGIDISKIDTWTEMKKAREDKDSEARTRAAQPGGQQATQEAGAAEAAAMHGTATETRDKGLSAKLSAVTQVHNGMVAKMDEETQDEYAEAWSKLITRFSKRLGKKGDETEETAPEQETIPEGAESAERKSA